MDKIIPTIAKDFVVASASIDDICPMICRQGDQRRIISTQNIITISTFNIVAS